MTRWFSRRRVVVLIGGLLVFWLVAAGSFVFRARSHLVEGRDRAEEVAERPVRDVLDGTAARELRAAADDFEDANGLIGNPVVVPLRGLPFVGRQIAAVDDLSSAAGDLAEAAASFLEAIEPYQAATSGAERLEGLRVVLGEIDGLQAALAGADLGESVGLVGPVHDAHFRLRQLKDELAVTMDDARIAGTALLGILEGPSDYLLLAANNAEMRAGHGALLAWGILHAEAGTVNLAQEMQPINTFPKGENPPADPSLDPWAWLDLSSVPLLGFSPRFDVTGDRVLDLYESATGARPHGVLVADIVALVELAELTGEVVVERDGATTAIETGDLLGFLLHDQYEDVPAEDIRGPNALRRARESSVAAQVMDGLFQEADLSALADRLVELVQNRHLLVHSTDPAVAESWRLLGVDGSLESNDVSVALVNRGGNKLDQFIDTTIDVATKAESDQTEVVLTITGVNRTPPDEPPYIVGEVPPDAPEGGYASLLTVHVPAFASEARVDGTETYAVYAPDGPATALAVPFDMPAGEQRIAVVRFTVPTGTVLRFLPTARVPEPAWIVDGEPREADGPFELQV